MGLFITKTFSVLLRISFMVMYLYSSSSEESLIVELA